MYPGAIYEEKIFSKWITAILAPVTALMFFLLGYQILVAPVGSNPAPTWILLILSLFFLGITMVFSRLVIRITPASVTVGYGIFKHTIPWDNIENCFLDESSAVKYGGSGIRIAKIGGKLRLVYSVIGGPRVVLSLKEGKYQELAFSTKNPEEVTRIIKEWVGTR